MRRSANRFRTREGSIEVRPEVSYIVFRSKLQESVTTIGGVLVRSGSCGSSSFFGNTESTRIDWGEG